MADDGFDSGFGTTLIRMHVVLPLGSLDSISATASSPNAAFRAMSSLRMVCISSRPLSMYWSSMSVSVSYPRGSESSTESGSLEGNVFRIPGAAVSQPDNKNIPVVNYS